MRTIVVVLLWISVLAPRTLLAGDRSASPHYQAPKTFPDQLVPEHQTDDFSCGFHALSAIYKSHGLDPAKARLRARLGTSRPAIPFVSDSTGTLQPDLFRVLQQDGFETSSIHPAEEEDRRRLITHLDRSQYCLALLRTERTAGLHWVVFTSHVEGRITVADSLGPETREEKLNDLIDGPLLSVILIHPGTPRPGSPYFWAQTDGLVEIVVTVWQSLSGVAILVLLVFLALVAGLLIAIVRSLLRRFRPAK